uniref:COesterase domain-containing protein n=1 Tax=Parastrongyloides trichosuri TaxID=131310 RepID=A0A0N4ZLS4_PARTI
MTKNGLLEGREINVEGKTVTEYLGVPYAMPPIGKDRFKPPQPQNNKLWRFSEEPETHNAKFPRNSCYQTAHITGDPDIDWRIYRGAIALDCLYLNIWKPKNPNGGVVEYNGSIVTAKTDLIWVNINYRLSIFGFGYLGKGKQIPGNVGLLDQQMAIEWIYRNIEAFGGDKSKITLLGHGTGAAFATAHMYAKGSSKYFSKIIALSGSIGNTWASVSNEFVEKKTREVAYQVNCTQSKDNEILACLQKVNQHALIVAAEKVMVISNVPYFYGFNTIRHDKNFFEEDLRIKIEKKKMNLVKGFSIMTSTSKSIGAYFLTKMIDREEFGCKFCNSKSKRFDENTCKMGSKEFGIFMKVLNKQLGLSYVKLKKLKDLYVNKKTKDYRGAAIKLLGDITSNCEITKSAMDNSQECCRKTYLFEYDARSSKGDYPKWMQPAPESELDYIFGIPFRNPDAYCYDKLKDEKKMSSKMMEIIRNFVFNGKPNSKWKVFKSKDKRAEVITNWQSCSDNVKYDKNIYSKACKSARSFLPKEYIIR